MKINSLSYLAAGVLTLSSASAAVISVNFRESDGHGNQLLAADTFAGGGAGVSASNWNTVDGQSGSAASLVDSAGSGTSAGITWNAGGVWGDGSANSDADSGNGNARMMRGYLDDGQTSGDVGVSLSFSNIPYAEYIVAIYFSTDFAPATPGFKVATVNDGSGPVTIQTTGPRQEWSDNPTLGAHNTAATGTLTGNALTITLPHRFATGDNPDQRGTVAGVQIIQIPEPSSIGLAGVAALGLALRRRRSEG
jgi:hypothetical protein